MHLKIKIKTHVKGLIILIIGINRRKLQNKI